MFIYLDYYSADQENLALAVHDELVLTSSAVQEEITIGGYKSPSISFKLLQTPSISSNFLQSSSSSFKLLQSSSIRRAVEKRLRLDSKKMVASIKEQLTLFDTRLEERDKHKEKYKAAAAQGASEDATKKRAKMKQSQEQLIAQTEALQVRQAACYLLSFLCSDNRNHNHNHNHNHNPFISSISTPRPRKKSSTR